MKRVSWQLVVAAAAAAAATGAAASDPAPLFRHGDTHGDSHGNVHPPSPFMQQVAAVLQPQLDDLAQYYNLSISVGLGGPADPFGFGLVAGFNNPGAAEPVKITTRSLFPAGSATKLYTAVAALQAQEQGLLDLDAPAVRYVDPFLQRTNGTTLAQLWNTTAVNAITVRQLLSMRGGLDDYDDASLHAFSESPATEGLDQTPYDFLHRWAKKDLLFPPDQGGAYSSVGFVLAGLAVAAVHNATAWTDFDQRSILPPALQAPLQDLTFKLLGRCSSYDRVVHQFTANITPSTTAPWIDVNFPDLYNGSCLNGWTMGNLAASASAMAGAVYNIFGRAPVAPLLTAASLREMNHYQPLTQGWGANGLMYGLGAINVSSFQTAGIPDEYFDFVGHPGQDYGSGVPVHGYNRAADISVVVAINAETGINCSQPDIQANFDVGTVVPCVTWRAVLSALSGGNFSVACPAPFNTDAAAVAGHGVALAQPPTAQRLGAASPPTQYVCRSRDNRVCAGASAGLDGAECYFWKQLHTSLRGWEWRRCSENWADPCGCAGVTCSADGAHLQAVDLSNHSLYGDLAAVPVLAATPLPQLRTLNLSHNMLFGALPPALASSAAQLTQLDVSHNLLVGALPPFNWSRLTGGCSLAGNEFGCPLPAAAVAHCSGAGTAPACYDLRNATSPACFAGLAAVEGNAAVANATGALYAAIPALYTAAAVNKCVDIYAVRQCNLTLDWTPYKDLVAAATAAIKAVDPGADFCFVDHDFSQTVPSVGAIAYRVNDGVFVAAPSACTAADREAILAFQASPPQCLAAGAQTRCHDHFSADAPATCATPGRLTATAAARAAAGSA